MTRCAFALSAAVFITARGIAADFPAPTNNQPITTPLPAASDAIGMWHLPDGFKATLFAAEPDVQQPIAMCWDERGRLWVAENYTYSDSKERFDLKLRDRILIFEDTDSDGHFDKRTVFADDLQMLTSIERGFGGVYALCPPNLLFIPTNGDKPSGPPRVILDGFATTAGSRHTFANGLKWGPDGWLYGRLGITSTSWVDVPGIPREKRQPTAGGIWRYHPITKVYEPYCHGTTNPWGTDWDEHGELFFINTVIGHFWHAIPGGHFKRMHGEDPYPHIYGLIDQHADHYHWDTGKKWMDTRDGKGLTDTLGGGHAHVGMMIYQGTNWPAQFRGMAFTLNLHGHRINVDHLERSGSGYVAKHDADFAKSDDPWFRGIEIQAGPDGGVFVLDWSDIGECHENDGVHRTSGRIYKIMNGTPTLPRETDLMKVSADELVKLQFSDNEWLVRSARWELRERRTRGEKIDLASLHATVKNDRDPHRRLRAAFAITTAGQFDREESLSLLRDRDEFIKTFGIHQIIGTRKVGNQSEMEPLLEEAFDEFLRLAKGDGTPRVRLALASALQKLNVQQCTQLAAALLAHEEDATDHNLPLMLWFGLRDLPPAELVKLAPTCRIPLVREFIARRVTEEIERAPGPLNSLLTLGAKSSDDLREQILAGMSAALKGWRKAPAPEMWKAFAATFVEATDVPSQTRLRDLEVLFGDGRALDEVTRIALDEHVDTDGRIAALRTLIDAKAPDLRPVCEKLLTLPTVGIVAAQGLAGFDDPELAKQIAKRYGGFYPHERPAAIAVLTSRPSFARVLLDQIADGKIPRTDLTPAHARQIRSFGDEALTKQLAAAWGEERESSDDKKKFIATLKSKLTPALLGKADQSKGRALFAQTCASCHRLYGEGASIGPDLTGSGRHDVNYLIENIADPSAMVAADFKMSIITLRDGRVLNGIIHGQTDRTLTVTAIGQEVTVDKGDVVKQEQLPVSLMPEGLLAALSDEQVRDLMGYLMGSAQVPLPQN